ncbi:MAG: hypothetical protein ACREQ5_40255, partial [Candidatus Dormibacteria bacterium]
GMAVLVDDPPVTGTKIASAADALEAVGFPRSAVVLLLGLFYHEEHLPARLRQRQVVTLPWPDWSLHDRLGGDGLVKSLTTMLAGRTIPAPGDHGTHKVRTVASAEPVALEPIGDPTARPLVRSHVRALVRAGLVAEDGSAVTLDVYVKGTGLGYFGRHSALVARLLAGSVPDAYGWRDGFLFRRAMPESGRLTRYGAPAEPAGDEQRRHDRSAGSSASCIASYVALRSARAAVPVDTSMRMSHRHTVWELAGDALTATLGRWAPIAGPPARRAARHLLRTSHPSVVDGNAMLAHWFDDDAGLGRKVDFDERAFSVWDQACYDGAWDLAGAAADHRVRV